MQFTSKFFDKNLGFLNQGSSFVIWFVYILFVASCTPTLREKCLYSEFFWSVFPHIRTEYGKIRRIQSECGKIRSRKTPNTDTFHTIQALLLPKTISIKCIDVTTQKMFSRCLNFCPSFFWSCSKNGLLRKLRLISKFMTSDTDKQIIIIHILLNISRSEGNQTMKFGQLKE